MTFVFTDPVRVPESYSSNLTVLLVGPKVFFVRIPVQSNVRSTARHVAGFIART